MRFLAMSGSLRARSSNSTLLRAAALVAPTDIEIAIYEGIGSLPHFNPDLDEDEPPAIVAALRSEVGRADALLVCSPEYAHGVPGSFKNALDWLVAGSEMIDKPVALLNASFRAMHAQASLRETLTVMSARVVDAASVTIALDARKGLDEQAMAADAEIANALRGALGELARAVHP